MKPSQIQELFKYTFWAFDSVWSAIDQINDNQFTSDLGYSHGSIRNIVVHMISSHRRWLARLNLAPAPPHLAFEAFPSRASAKAEWDRDRKEWLRYAESLTQEALDESIPYLIPGRTVDTETTRWRVLLHLVNHSTDHRSQILALLNTSFGISTPEQDFIIYLWQQHDPRP